MIAKQLRNDVEKAIDNYIKHFPRNKDPFFKRDEHIAQIAEILKKSDPVDICLQLRRYVNTIVVPWLQWIRILEANNFIGLIKILLAQPKYSDVNLLREMLLEKNNIIASYANRSGSTVNSNLVIDAAIELKITEVTEELQLLRTENEFLYTEIASRDAKIKQLEMACRKGVDQEKWSKLEVSVNQSHSIVKSEVDSIEMQALSMKL